MAAFFSIIIPLYNKENHIKDTLDSVFRQTFQNFEIIVVNDGSTDQSPAVVNQISDSRLQIHNIKNQGVSQARNFGVSRASSDLIVFLDADDLWRSNHLENLQDLYLSFPNCGMYATAYLKRNRKVIIPSVYKNIPVSKKWKGVVKDYFDSSTVNSIAWTSAVMVPKATLQEVGYFNEAITQGAGEDTDLWIRIALKYPVAFNNQVSAIHNLHTDNRISHSNTNLRRFIDLDLYEKEAKLNLSLKKYLDLNRFSIAIQYKRHGNSEKANQLIEAMNLENLNVKQRALLKLNPKALNFAFRIKSQLQNSGILLNTFR